MSRSISILQAGLTNRDSAPWRFMDYDFAEGHGFNILAYTTVYEYDDENLSDDDSRALDLIYSKFNLDLPSHYNGRSLSVSDIVVLDENAYYVNSIGFEYLGSIDDLRETADYTTLFEHYDKCYEDLYAADVAGKETAGYYEAMKFTEQLLHDEDFILGAFMRKRQDPLTSDRELAAFGFAITDLGWR